MMEKLFARWDCVKLLRILPMKQALQSKNSRIVSDPKIRSRVSIFFMLVLCTDHPD